MDELENIAARQAKQRALRLEQEQFLQKREDEFAVAKEVMLGAFACLEIGLQNKSAIATQARMRHDPEIPEVTYAEEFTVYGPWVPHVTKNGPLNVRIKGNYRDIRFSSPYISQSVVLEAKNESNGSLTGITEVGKIWHCTTPVGNMGVQVGERQRGQSTTEPNDPAVKRFLLQVVEVSLDGI